MRNVQMKVFNGELAGAIQEEINIFLVGKEIHRIITIHSEQGSYVYVLIFYYTDEVMVSDKEKLTCVTKMFQGPAASIEEFVNRELKQNIFNDISLSKGWGDYLKAVLIVMKKAD